MTLTSSNAEDEALRIQNEMHRLEERVEADPELTSEGKTAALSKAFDEASARMAALKGSHAEETAVSELDIQRLLFGASNLSGADAVSQRDAMARAAQVQSPDEAFKLLQQAEWSGDVQLERAVARACYEASMTAPGEFSNRWRQLVDLYASRTPGLPEKLAELRQLQAQTRARNIRNGMVFRVPKPSRIR